VDKAADATTGPGVGEGDGATLAAALGEREGAACGVEELLLPQPASTASATPTNQTCFMQRAP